MRCCSSPNLSLQEYCAVSALQGTRTHINATHFKPDLRFVALIFRHSAALFTTLCVEDTACIHGPWFFVVVTIIGLCLSLFFLVSSSKPNVSFFDGALQVISLYFQLCTLRFIFLLQKRMFNTVFSGAYNRALQIRFFGCI